MDGQPTIMQQLAHDSISVWASKNHRILHLFSRCGNTSEDKEQAVVGIQELAAFRCHTCDSTGGVGKVIAQWDKVSDIDLEIEDSKDTPGNTKHNLNRVARTVLTSHLPKSALPWGFAQNLDVMRLYRQHVEAAYHKAQTELASSPHWEETGFDIYKIFLSKTCRETFSQAMQRLPALLVVIGEQPAAMGGGSVNTERAHQAFTRTLADVFLDAFNQDSCSPAVFADTCSMAAAAAKATIEQGIEGLRSPATWSQIPFDETVVAAGDLRDTIAATWRQAAGAQANTLVDKLCEAALAFGSWNPDSKRAVVVSGYSIETCKENLFLLQNLIVSDGQDLVVAVPEVLVKQAHRFTCEVVDDAQYIENAETIYLNALKIAGGGNISFADAVPAFVAAEK